MSLKQFFDEGWPPAPEWTEKDVPDLTGKVYIVTGATAGIGKETARVLLLNNAKVYIGGRSEEKIAKAIAELKDLTGKEGIPFKVDLADLPTIKAAAEDFTSKEKQLHVLINNAGVMIPPIENVTAQGYDCQWGTNVLGHFYLTKLLLPLLLSTAKASPEGKARVVHVSSQASVGGKLDFNAFKDVPARRNKTPWDMYYMSKLGNVMMSNEFAMRYGSEGLVSCSLNPGNIQSELLRHTSWLEWLLLHFFIKMHPVGLGALTQLWAATSKEGLDFNGKYLKPWARIGQATPQALDEKVAGDLWEWLEEQVAGL